jgi:pyoverdine/dityrosine biosynthesis protein Dit1
LSSHPHYKQFTDKSSREGNKPLKILREGSPDYYDYGKSIQITSQEELSSSPAISLFIVNDRQLSRNMQNKQPTGTL